MSKTFRTIALALLVTSLMISLGTAAAVARGPAQDPNGAAVHVASGNDLLGTARGPGQDPNGSPSGATAAVASGHGSWGVARGPAQDPNGAVVLLASGSESWGTARGPAQDPNGSPNGLGAAPIEVVSSLGRGIDLLLSV